MYRYATLKESVLRLITIKENIEECKDYEGTLGLMDEISQNLKEIISHAYFFYKDHSEFKKFTEGNNTIYLDLAFSNSIQ